jgi:hypothetical protein
MRCVVQRPAVSFRMSFWRLLFVVILWSIPLGVTIGVSLALVFTAAFGMTVPPLVMATAVFVATAGGELVAAVLVLPLIAYYKVYVSPDGVRAYNFWGVYRFARWADFRRVALGSFLGLPLLRAYTDGAWTPLWLPLFLADWDGFCALVRTHAGAEHPLTVALAEAGPH